MNDPICRRCGFPHGYMDACLLEMPIEEKLNLAIDALESISIDQNPLLSDLELVKETLKKINGNGGGYDGNKHYPDFK